MKVLLRVLDLVVSLVEFSFLLVVAAVQAVLFVLAGLFMIIEDRLFY